ncbi:uncharacterized protein VTP21DRAFT_8686 [Calcarisporiella thermophila]|uniref:uncharacterized protein n=1 Tax=Calcarisporiella thermophila TaxID=911321 RepID=UPI00374331DF
MALNNAQFNYKFKSSFQPESAVKSQSNNMEDRQAILQSTKSPSPTDKPEIKKQVSFLDDLWLDGVTDDLFELLDQAIPTKHADNKDSGRRDTQVQSDKLVSQSEAKNGDTSEHSTTHDHSSLSNLATSVSESKTTSSISKRFKEFSNENNSLTSQREVSPIPHPGSGKQTPGNMATDLTSRMLNTSVAAAWPRVPNYESRISHSTVNSDNKSELPYVEDKTSAALSQHCTYSERRPLSVLPGPAGNLPPLTPAEKEALFRSKRGNRGKVNEVTTTVWKSPTSSPPSSRFSGNLNAPKEDEFNRGAWLILLKELNIPEYKPSALGSVSLPPDLSKNTVQAILSADVTKATKIPRIILLIRELRMNDTDAAVGLIDPTGEIQGTIHKKVFDVYGNNVCNGTALELIQVSIITPSPRSKYLNITLSNINRLCSPHSNAILGPMGQIQSISDRQNSRKLQAISPLQLKDTVQTGASFVENTSMDDESDEECEQLLRKKKRPDMPNITAPSTSSATQAGYSQPASSLEAANCSIAAVAPPNIPQKEEKSEVREEEIRDLLSGIEGAFSDEEF